MDRDPFNITANEALGHSECKHSCDSRQSLRCRYATQTNKSKLPFMFMFEKAIQLNSTASLNQINEITILFVNIVAWRVKCDLSA